MADQEKQIAQTARNLLLLVSFKGRGCSATLAPMKKLTLIFSQLVLLLILVITSITPASAKVALGVQNLTTNTPQSEVLLEATVHLGSRVFSYDDALGSPLVTKGGTTTLYRAVGPDELADIQKTKQLINRGSAEGKYFTTSAEHASSYAKQAVNAFGDAPYTIVKTKVPKSSLPSPVSVDRGIPAYVVPNKSLQNLKPEVLNSMPIP